MKHLCQYFGVQVCSHTGPEVDPDHRDADVAFTNAKVTSEFISRFFKGVAKTPSIVEPCMYTVSYLLALKCSS